MERERGERERETNHNTAIKTSYNRDIKIYIYNFSETDFRCVGCSGYVNSMTVVLFANRAAMRSNGLSLSRIQWLH